MKFATIQDVELLRSQGVPVLIIPSLCVRTLKSKPTRYKSRLVACGNFELSPSQKEDVTTYANTVEPSFFRLLLFLHVQMRGSVCSLDIREAFTQTGEKESKTWGTGSRLFFKLPSQWKAQIAPSMITKMAPDKIRETLLEVIKSIYGQATAPKAWMETFASHLIKDQHFSQSVYDECTFFKFDTSTQHWVLSLIHI